MAGCRDGGDSVFSRIMRGELPADVLYEDDDCIVIKDRFPQAPTHLLVIPRKPLVNIGVAGEEDKPLLGHLMWVAGEMARKLGIDDGFRVIINNGPGGGQTVFHLHLHLLANKAYREEDLDF